MLKSTLNLFNCIQIDNNEIHDHLSITASYGIILDPRILINFHELDQVIDHLKLNFSKLNNSFHKSWDKIKNSPIEDLILDQMVHYITTYGFEALDIYNEKFVYIPDEVLSTVNFDVNKIKFLYIKGMTKEEILDEIIKLSTVALNENTLEDIMNIFRHNQYDSSVIDKIGNRELKSLLYDFYGVYPTEPVEFLRYLIVKLTGESLLIKNKEMIERIKQSDKNELDKLIENAPDNLAEIFFRFKPLFLAMKKISNNKTYFNKLRRKANKIHKPQPIDYLNSVTDLIGKEEFKFSKYTEKLKNASVFRKIRLLYSLNYRLSNNESIVYKIRNGKSWATELNKIDSNTDLWLAYKLCYNSIVNDLKKFNKDEKIYIPNNINYALPSTEKSFIGNIPEKSYISVTNDIILGIHWYNHTNRTDLDLSLTEKNMKIGWDGYYRSDDLKVLFSGDITDAPKPDGASEMFYISRLSENPWVLNVNDYTHTGYEKIKFKFFIANEKTENLYKNYMVDPNNILMETHFKTNKVQTVLGMLMNTGKENRFYFYNFGSGNSISSRTDGVSKHVQNYMMGSIKNFIGLKDLLTQADIELVDTPEESTIDLSLENIDKNSILNLFKEK